MRTPPRPLHWADVTIRFSRFSFPDLEVVLEDVQWYKSLHHGGADPPPCLECPTRVVFYCQETATECRCYRQYLAKDIE
jgi:hypothetical protein